MDDLRARLAVLLASWDELAESMPAGYAAGISDAATELRGVLCGGDLAAARRVPASRRPWYT